MYFTGQQYRKHQAEFKSQNVGRGLQFAGVYTRSEVRRIVMGVSRSLQFTNVTTERSKLRGRSEVRSESYTESQKDLG